MKKIALLTGASSGIVKATATCLSEARFAAAPFALVRPGSPGGRRAAQGFEPGVAVHRSLASCHQS